MKKILLILIISIVILVTSTACNKFGFGNGNGNGDGNSIGTGNKEQVNTNDVKVKTDDEIIVKNEKNTIVTIKVEDTNIFIDDLQCTSIDDLKNTIIKLQSEDESRKYIYLHDYAIKSTYDEVKSALESLEENLNIVVEY